MEIYQKEGQLTFARIDRDTPVIRSALQSNQILCVASTVAGNEEEEEEDHMARSSA